jgi:hypothetical protein
MSKIEFSFSAQSTGSGLSLIVYFDDHLIFNNTLSTDVVEISHEFDDDIEMSHTVIFEMSGKQSNHTVIDEHGEILQDLTMTLKDFKLDDIELGHMFFGHCQYHHDYNGTSDTKIDDFWGTMGCNGRVEFRFSSPTYVWLLENMQLDKYCI